LTRKLSVSLGSQRRFHICGSGFSVCRIVIGNHTTIFDGRQPPAGYDGHGRLAISYVLWKVTEAKTGVRRRQ
jgi:hypothetical protein